MDAEAKKVSVESVELGLLGPFRFSVGGRQIVVSTKKNRGLLAVLAMSPGRQATRERLCGLLWGDRGEEQARSSLRQSLAVLRKEIGDAESRVIQTKDDIVLLLPVRCDATAVLAVGDHAGADELREAVAHSHGELLADTTIHDDAFETWLAAERRRIGDKLINLLEKLTGLEKGQAAVAFARRLVDLDPLREASHRALMRAYHHVGETALALQQFESCKKLLAVEFGVTAAAETIALHAKIVKGERATVASPVAAVTPKLSIQQTKPSIAVLPFVNMSGEAGQEFFVDGLTEDIITDLSNVPGFFVIARNSTFAYKGKAIDVRQIAEELGVRYVLEGSVRRSEDRLRVNAQLIDATSGGNHIWAERIDKKMVDVFQVQDEVTQKVVEAIARHLKVEVAVVVQSQHPKSLDAYDLCLKSRNLFTLSREANVEAEDMLQRALVLDPDYAEAHWQLAMVRAFNWLQWGEPEQPNRSLSLSSAQAALKANAQDSNANWVMGYVLLNERRWDEARPFYEKAILINSNNAEAHASFANFEVLTGRPAHAVELANRVLQLNPQPPSWCLWARGFAFVANGQFEDAIDTLRRQEVYRTVARRVLAAALALSGRTEEASREMRFFLNSFPSWRISTWLQTQPFQHKADIQFWDNAYRLAGFPE
jgi:adenylate cyclase